MDKDAAALRKDAARHSDAKAARRILAIAMVLEGTTRTSAAQCYGMDRQTLRDWVHRYNDEGLDGLCNRKPRGRAALPSAAQKAELKEIVRQGSDREVDGVVRWRLVDLKREIEKRFGVVMHVRTVGKQLAKLGFRRLSVRPQHPKSDPEKQQEFKKIWTLVEALLPPQTQGKPVEIWFQDEARVGQKGTLTRIWAEKGTRPRAPRDTGYTSAYIFGAACPQTAQTAALVMPHANCEAMNAHLEEISKAVAPQAHAIVVCDRAGWHLSANKLNLPDNISLLPLPAYAPELNPMENVWEYLRKNKLAITTW